MPHVAAHILLFEIKAATYESVWSKLKRTLKDKLVIKH